MPLKRGELWKKLRLFMPRVMFVTLTLVLCLSFFIVARPTRSAKLTYVDELLRALWTNPDGSRCSTSCMFGVQLEITKFEDSADILKSHPFVHVQNVYTATSGPTYPSLEIDLPENIYIIIFGDRNGLVVSELVLYFEYMPTPPPIIADIIANLGLPQSVGRYLNKFQNRFWIDFFYPFDTVIYCDLALGRAVRPNIPVKSIKVSLISDFTVSPSFIPSPWQGFKRYPNLAIGPKA